MFIYRARSLESETTSENKPRSDLLEQSIPQIRYFQRSYTGSTLHKVYVIQRSELRRTDCGLTVRRMSQQHQWPVMHCVLANHQTSLHASIMHQVHIVITYTSHSPRLNCRQSLRVVERQLQGTPYHDLHVGSEHNYDDRISSRYTSAYQGLLRNMHVNIDLHHTSAPQSIRTASPNTTLPASISLIFHSAMSPAPFNLQPRQSGQYAADKYLRRTRLMTIRINTLHGMQASGNPHTIPTSLILRRKVPKYI